MIVTLRRYPVHTFAEFGAVPRTLGNVSPIARHGGWEWSSVNASGIVYDGGQRGYELAELAMVRALEREGFTVDPLAPVRRQAVECVTCGPCGRRGCTGCHGTGRVWPDGGVEQFESSP